jgi:putative phosphoesterase
MRIGLISDTHGKLRSAVFDVLAGVDVIIHAGDIGPIEILTELEAIAPVHAVLGNTDGMDLVPRVEESITHELEGHRIVVVHGHQFGTPSPDRLRAAFPAADIVVYGHTHRPLIDVAARPIVVNPGAAGPPRFNLRPSVGIMVLRRDEPPQVTIHPLDAAG